MSQSDLTNFFTASLTVGAILAGFCGTFLSFRIQREAGYYRSPDCKGKDAFSNLSHFTASLLLLLLATLCTAVCGIVLPLLALVGSGLRISPGLIVGGVIGGLLLLAAYFVTELCHYDVFKFLRDDPAEWKREWPLVAAGVFGTAFCFWYFGLR
jgi:drug/metabolite transporter (DMT)-like permease